VPILATDGKRALGLAELVEGLVSIVDRDLLVPRLLRWSWLALCASSRRAAAVRLETRATAAAVRLVEPDSGLRLPTLGFVLLVLGVSSAKYPYGESQREARAGSP
jgi:hypothetical protein